MTQTYDAKSIEQLTFREGVRKRVGIYLGSADHTGVLAGLLELVNNATDEGLVCPDATTIELSIWPDKVSCRDYGRGMPHGPNDFSKEVMINLLTENHSGAKFNDNAYGGKSRGLNGTGSAATCCSSDWFEITSYRDGAEWFMRFDKGVPQFEECQKTTPLTKKRGTYIIYAPSQEVFSAEPINFNYNEICDIIKEYAYFNKNITFVVTNEVTKEVRKFVSKNGLIDFAHDNIKDPIHPTPITYFKTEDNIDIEIILQWTKHKEQFYLFSNGGANPNGGTPLTGIKTALTNFMKKQFKGETDPDLFKTGLVCICSVNLKNPIYDGQTKSKITNPELRGLAQRVTTIALEDFMNSSRSEFNQVVDFLAKERKAEEAADKARQAVLTHQKDFIEARKKKFINNKKLHDAEVLGEDSILLLVEGDSAAASMALARDTEKYGILGLKGKIINCLSSTIEEILENEEVKIFLLASGIDIMSYSAKKLRYGKIAICVDSDDDGSHIACLIMALLQKLAPQFIKENRLYWLKAPLYKIEKGNETLFYFDEEELNTSKFKGTQTRFKGLGQMSPDDAKLSMFSKNQHLEAIIWSESGVKLLEELMGEDVTPRKEFIFREIDFSKYGEV